jgi:Bacterial Ig domain
MMPCFQVGKKVAARYARIAGKLLLPLIATIAVAAGHVVEPLHDHHELDATLSVPYRAAASDESRTFTLKFSYPATLEKQVAHWRLQLLAPQGVVIDEFRGETPLERGEGVANVTWGGRTGKHATLADGVYRARMTAFHVAKSANRKFKAAGIDFDSGSALDDLIDQTWEFRVGEMSAAPMPAFTPMTTAAEAKRSAGAVDAGASSATAKSAPALNSLPYTVYYANLHSQTNHSDGGGNVSSCSSSQPAQSGQFGPADAFAYAKNAGLDILVASEHNHYFDGSSNTNTAANPSTVKALYQSGLTAASNFNAANPGFLAVYGMEWGVISNGGHMNIFNANELLGWETNTSGQLLADTLTPKSDYATLYALMKQRGWIGQFNHPDTSGQFVISGTSLAYSADADEVMVLSEILNTSAFSSNTTETETGRSSFEGAFNTLLERGFHIAPASNQDNHCANWGRAYTNRTGILIPNGTALSQASFVDALRARRVFATMDKNSQIVLTANGRVMGERFQNSGALNLVANFANSSGRTVSTVTIYEGVPGRNGAVTTLANTATATVTPLIGQHFYYAKITQDDGKILWSAPVWVEQVASADTTPPTVIASSAGTSATINFSANATDNVGVTRVEYFVDNVLRGTDTTAPYGLAFNSTALTDGSHTLVAKAYDAAGNVGTSPSVTFSVTNTTPQSTQLIANSGFESGTASWIATSGVITNSSNQAARAGSWKAWLNGYGSANTETLYQQIAIPSSATTVTLSFWLRVESAETSTTTAFDTLKVQLRSTTGAVLTTLATYSNLNKGAAFVQRTFDIAPYKGQTVRVYFEGVEGARVATSFIIDDVTVTAQ